MIEMGKAIVGIELGSTRIKSVMIDEAHNPIASGSHDWENKLVGNIWTYSLDDIWSGLQDSYHKMAEDVKEKYDAEIHSLAGIGFSAMMHGYMAFNEDNELLVPFRTWRNTITGPAAEQLTKLFQYNIPKMEYCTSVSSNSQQGRTHPGHYILHHLVRIHSLATDR